MLWKTYYQWFPLSHLFPGFPEILYIKSIKQKNTYIYLVLDALPRVCYIYDIFRWLMISTDMYWYTYYIINNILGIIVSISNII